MEDLKEIFLSFNLDRARAGVISNISRAKAKHRSDRSPNQVRGHKNRRDYRVLGAGEVYFHGHNRGGL